MSVLWKKIEFYMGDSNHEAILIAAGPLGMLRAPQMAGFAIMGGTGYSGTPSLVQSKNNHASHQKSTSLP